MQIERRYDQKRGCGWRKPGGLYLMCSALAEDCCKMPLPLSVCPACGRGIKPSGNWMWVNPAGLLPEAPYHMADRCRTCPLGGTVQWAGLLWVGDQFYQTPGKFVREAGRLGVSRRIASIPQGFVVGTTWVLLAHRRAAPGPGGALWPGIFAAFRPTAIEYVVKADDSAKKLEGLARRGVRLVKVERVAGPGDAEGVPLLAGESNGV